MSSSVPISCVFCRQLVERLETRYTGRVQLASKNFRPLLIHDLLFRSYLYHCVWSVITAHNLTPEKHVNNSYSPHPLTPTSCLRNNI